MTESGSTSDRISGAQPDEAVLAALASETRRVALRELRGDASRTLEDLAAAMVADDAVPHESAERLGQRLHHCHLPRLDSSGLCRYDPDDLRVEYAGDETVERYLATFEE